MEHEQLQRVNLGKDETPLLSEWGLRLTRAVAILEKDERNPSPLGVGSPSDPQGNGKGI